MGLEPIKPRLNMKKFLFLIILAPFVVLLSSVIKIQIPEVWHTQNLALLFLFFIAIVLFIWDFNKYLATFLGVCLLSTFFVSQLNSRALILLFHLSLGIMASYGISKFSSDKHDVILKGILVLVIIQTSLLLLQNWNIDPFFKSLVRQGMKETVGFSGSKGQMGAFFALTAPVLAYLHPAFLLITLVGLAFAKSSFAFIASLVSTLLYFFLTNRKLFYKFLLGILIISTAFFGRIDKMKPFDFDIRFSVWKHAFNSVASGQILLQKQNSNIVVKTNPFLGYGFGNFLRLFPYVPQDATSQRKFNCIDEKFTHAHNDYVETIVFELGYIGIVAFILLFVNFIVNFIKTKKNKKLILYFSCIVAYLLNASGYFISHIAVSGTLLIIFYGLYEGCRKQIKNV